MNRCGLALLLLVLGGTAGAVDRVDIARFESGDLSGWEEQVFHGKTLYRYDAEQRALRADSHASASGLVKKIRVDLQQTPYLNWRWRVPASLPPLDERSKAGDDYVARIYVVVSGGLLFWKTRALNYVWSSSQPVGSLWPNAYTRQVQMLAVRSGDAHTGRWLQQKRNVRKDLQRAFGTDIRYIDAVAIMSDSDNSGLSSRAFYGDIFFSSH